MFRTYNYKDELHVTKAFNEIKEFDKRIGPLLETDKEKIRFIIKRLNVAQTKALVFKLKNIPARDKSEQYAFSFAYSRY